MKTQFHYRFALSSKFVHKYITSGLDYVQEKWNTRKSFCSVNGNVKLNQQKMYNRNEDLLKAENSLHAAFVQYWRNQVSNVAKYNKAVWKCRSQMHFFFVYSRSHHHTLLKQVVLNSLQFGTASALREGVRVLSGSVAMETIIYCHLSNLRHYGLEVRREKNISELLWFL